MHRPRYYLFSLALFTFLTGGNIDAAMRSYRRAMDIVPNSATNGEAPFWVGITLADQGRINDAISYLRRAYRQHEDWARMGPAFPMPASSGATTSPSASWRPWRGDSDR